ncbi:MAG: hypothetical protein FJ146_06155 [Deltaproteobacteria bacterium]|nr:hypothetical protein [Deltaproteobacteria bacterium]
MKIKFMKLRILIGLSTINVIGCEKSTFGPTLLKPEISGDDVENQDGSASTNSTSIRCTPNPTRSYFYAGSSILQNFSCTQSISDVQSQTSPYFLNNTFSSTSLSFTGTAPSSSSDQTWDFFINGITGTPFSTRTIILETTSLVSILSSSNALDTSNNGTSNNNKDFDLGHTSTLDSKWDGSMADVSLKIKSISSDIPGLMLPTSCGSSSGSYICNGTASSSDRTINNGLVLHWRWSAFDQGSYFIDMIPEITIEGGQTTLPSKSFSASIPRQPLGNIEILAANDPDSSNSFDSLKYRYGIAVSDRNSTPVSPIAGLIYMDQGSGDRAYFQRVTVDRESTPGGSSTGIALNGSPLEQSNATSQDFSINQLSDGSWAVVGGIATTGSFDILFNKINDSTSSPTINGPGVQLTSFSNTTEKALEVSTTKSFVDNGTERMGIVFVRKNDSSSQSNLTVAKINPNGTNLTTILDDVKYGVANSGVYSRFQMPVTTNGIDRIRMRWLNESGTGYFYVAYRQNTDLKILRMRSQYASGYGESSATLTAAAFANSDTSSNMQSLDLAVGTVAGSNFAAVVYRTNSGDCYFRRVGSDLQPSAAIKFTSRECYNPTIHFTSSGRFVATYAERQISPSSKYDIKTTEFIISSVDTYSTPVVVVADLVDYPIKLVTDLYADGNWMAIFYRLYSSPTLRFHGYHVPGR